MLALVSACGCPRVSFRNTKGLFRSAAVFGREKVGRYFPYSCPNPNLHRLRLETQLVFFVQRMKKLTVMVVDDEPVVADTILEILKEEGIDGFWVFQRACRLELVFSDQPGRRDYGCSNARHQRHCGCDRNAETIPELQSNSLFRSNQYRRPVERSPFAGSPI